MRKKLIRDLIPEKLFEMGANPISCNISQAENDKEYTYLLWEKLYEEVREFVDTPNIEELADIVEAAICILSNQDERDIPYQELVDALIYKKLSKGSFKKGYIMTLNEVE